MSDTEPLQEPGDTDAQDQVAQNDEGTLETTQERPKPNAKKNVTVIREEGRSLLPHSRVQKIIKADKVPSLIHWYIMICAELIWFAGASNCRTRSCLCHICGYCASQAS